MINWSGLKKTYWIPKLEWGSDREGLWFFGLKFLRLQVGLYSVAMAQYIVERIMKGIS